MKITCLVKIRFFGCSCNDDDLSGDVFVLLGIRYPASRPFDFTCDGMVLSSIELRLWSPAELANEAEMLVLAVCNRSMVCCGGTVFCGKFTCCCWFGHSGWSNKPANKSISFANISIAQLKYCCDFYNQTNRFDKRLFEFGGESSDDPCDDHIYMKMSCLEFCRFFC